MKINPFTRRELGAKYERFARRYLERAGLKFIAANAACQVGEVDLIMQDKQTWVFVEVRYRASDAFGTAAASVTYAKQQRLLRAAAVWLAKHNASFEISCCRFDVLAITGSQIEWLPDAFSA